MKCIRCLFIPASRPGSTKTIKSATLLSSLQRQVFSKGGLTGPWFSNSLQVHPPAEVVLGSQKKLIYSVLASHPFSLMFHKEQTWLQDTWKYVGFCGEIVFLPLCVLTEVRGTYVATGTKSSSLNSHVP